MNYNEIPEAWNIYFCQIENKPATIRLNLALYDVAPIADYSHLVHFAVKMKNPTKEGFPSDEELNTLYDIEDTLVQVFNSKKVIYAGVTKNNSLLEFWGYATNLEGIEESLFSVLNNQFEGYEASFESFEEPDWNTYFEFLFPDPYTYQSIRNRAVCVALEENGDNLEIPREIEHWIYFSSQENTNTFKKEVEKLGYAIIDEEKLDDLTDDTYPYQLHISRKDAPAEIDPVKWELIELANAHGGDYDGWETHIVKG